MKSPRAALVRRSVRVRTKHGTVMQRRMVRASAGITKHSSAAFLRTGAVVRGAVLGHKLGRAAGVAATTLGAAASLYQVASGAMGGNPFVMAGGIKQLNFLRKHRAKIHAASAVGGSISGAASGFAATRWMSDPSAANGRAARALAHLGTFSSIGKSSGHEAGRLLGKSLGTLVEHGARNSAKSKRVRAEMERYGSIAGANYGAHVGRQHEASLHGQPASSLAHSKVAVSAAFSPLDRHVGTALGAGVFGAAAAGIRALAARRGIKLHEGVVGHAISVGARGGGLFAGHASAYHQNRLAGRTTGALNYGRLAAASLAAAGAGRAAEHGVSSYVSKRVTNGLGRSRFGAVRSRAESMGSRVGAWAGNPVGDAVANRSFKLLMRGAT